MSETNVSGPQKVPSTEEPPERKRFWEKDSPFRRILKYFGIPEVVNLVIAVAVVWAAWKFIDWRIERVVSDENYIRRVAALVRPSVIFDSRKRILADLGAMRYIDKIDIEGTAAQIPKFPGKIVVHPKRHLSIAPMVTCIEGGVGARFTTERGEHFDWIFTTEDVAGFELDLYHFRLDLLE